MLAAPAGAAPRARADERASADATANADDTSAPRHRTTTTDAPASDETARPRRTTTTAEALDAPGTTETPTTAVHRTTTTEVPVTTTEAPAARTAAAPEHTESVTTTTTTTTVPVVETTESTDSTPRKRYIVVLKKGNKSSDVAAEHARTRHVKVDRVYGSAINGYAADATDDEVSALRKDSRVAYVAPDTPLEVMTQTVPWGVDKVSHAGNSYSSTKPGDGQGSVNLDVYIIDTGIASNPDINGGTEVNFAGGPDTDCDGHGTHMAGIVGAIDNDSGFVGVAPGVRVHGVKALDCKGRGTATSAIAGVDWVVAHGARPAVITMSFGGPISKPFDDAVTRAVAAGFVVTTAAGNEHRDACKLSPAHMGTLNGVITVGATNQKDKPAAFSNTGKCVDMWAPGVNIPSYWLNGAIAIATGTSGSAPHVAGVAALYLTGSGSKAPADAEAALKSHAVKIKANLLRVSALGF